MRNKDGLTEFDGEMVYDNPSLELHVRKNPKDPPNGYSLYARNRRYFIPDRTLPDLTRDTLTQGEFERMLERIQPNLVRELRDKMYGVADVNLHDVRVALLHVALQEERDFVKYLQDENCKGE